MKGLVLGAIIFNFNVEILRVYSSDFLAIKEVKVKKFECTVEDRISTYFGRNI